MKIIELHGEFVHCHILPRLIAREYGKHVQKHTYIYLDGQIGFKTNPDAQQHIATPSHRSTGSLR